MRRAISTTIFGALSCFCLFLVLSANRECFGEPVDPSRAAIAARGWYGLRFQDNAQEQPLAAGPESFITGQNARPIVAKETTIGFAFDVPEGGCIVIVAEDELSPVFYYSRDDTLQVPGVPAAQAIMEGLAEVISELRNLRERRTGPRHPLWAVLAEAASEKGEQALDAFPSSPVGPLLSTRWNQIEPYWDKCPIYLGKHCYVGCVATAMAQIMRYWKHPVTGTGSHSYDWRGTVLSADFGSTTYNWAAMPNSATSLSPLVVKNALSTLSYHCGVSLDMNYSPDGSSASMYGDRLTNYFGYLPTSTVWKLNYTDEGWYGLMCEQVNKGCPVWYSIQNHALVMDGYDSPNLLHLNMGWGGVDDGFWSLQKYPPQYAVIDIRPDRPAISRSPTSVSASCWKGKNPGNQSFEVWNSGGSTLEYSISEDVSWLSCSPTSGTSTGEHDTIVITYAASSLAVGSYSTSITINAVGTGITPQTVQVKLSVTEPPPPAISLSPTTLSGSCGEGKNVATQSFELWNSAGKTLNYSISDNASWLSCSPTSGASTGEHDTIGVNFTTSGLTPGTYSGTITISASGASNTPQTIPVGLTVTAPEILLSLQSLRNGCQGGTNASARSFEVWTSGGKTLNYSITDDAMWLSCTPSTGASASEHDAIAINYATSALSSGVYCARIIITASGASNSPQTMPVCLTVVGTSGSAIRHVDGSVTSSGDGTTWTKALKTIQQAIDAASDGDTIVVAPGTYVENIRFNGKNIVLRSTNPTDPGIIATTVIDGSRAESVVTFNGSEGESCALSGFTIRNGRGEHGGGIRGMARGSSLINLAVIENNVIVGNSTPWHGGGIAWCYGVIRNNLIVGNTAGWEGGGIWGSGRRIQNNTIVANSAATGGGVCSCEGPILNCIIWGNTAPTGSQFQPHFNMVAPLYSCIQGWTGGGEGNIATDPLLVDPGGNDYHLAPGSPCIDAGRNENWTWRATDMDGNNRIFYGVRSATVDMGAYEFGSFPFRMLSLVEEADGRTRLTWLSRPGDTYVIWSHTGLLGGEWTGAATVPSQGPMTWWTDGAPSGHMKFYRIETR